MCLALDTGIDASHIGHVAQQALLQAWQNILSPPPSRVYIQNKQEHREAADPHSHTVQAGSNQVQFCMAMRIKAASNASIHKLLSKAVKVLLACKTAPCRSLLYRSPLQLGSHQSSTLNGLVRHAT